MGYPKAGLDKMLRAVTRVQTRHSGHRCALERQAGDGGAMSVRVLGLLVLVVVLGFSVKVIGSPS
jgi:hypothetical protein